jgi:hypothetical protein
MCKRDIKFRAWDKHKNRMLTPIGLNDFFHVDFDKNGNIVAFNGMGENVELMQFTGLHDKNGVEVYECDLLRYPAESKYEEINYRSFEVFFHGGDANGDYNIGYSINRSHNYGNLAGGYVPPFKPKTVSEMEVIGNIHENKELI